MLHSNFYRHCFLILNVANISHSYLLQVFIALKYFINIYIKALRPVCPNCHMIIHCGEDRPYSIEEVKSLMSNTHRKNI